MLGLRKGARLHASFVDLKLRYRTRIRRVYTLNHKKRDIYF